MTDIEQPAEEPEGPPAEDPAPEPEPAPETPETPTEEPDTGPEAPVWLAVTRVRYEDGDGNEFFCGPGEAIPDEYVEQVGVDNVTAG